MRWILVPTDYSACANNAVRYAIKLARQGNYRLLFMHSIYSLKNDAELLVGNALEYKLLRKKKEAFLRKYLVKQYDKAGIKPGKIVAKIYFGESFTAHMYELMTEKEFSLIVMGTKGKGGNSFLTGSNTRKLIAGSPVPVLSVPGGAKFSRIRELVYLTDMKNYPVELRKLKPLARTMEAKISIVHYNYGWALDDAEQKELIKLRKRGDIGFTEAKVSIDIPLIEHLKLSRRKVSSLFCLFHDHKSVFNKILTGSASEEASFKLGRPILSIQRP